MRRVTLVAPVQLGLELDGITVAPADRWVSLPEPCRREALLLLARLISRDVFEPEDQEGECDG